MAYRKPSKSFKFSEEALRERDHYKNNRRQYYRDCLMIKDRTGEGLVALNINFGQEALERLRDDVVELHREIADHIARSAGRKIKPEPVKIQVLKARRGGFSTDIEAQMKHYCEFNSGRNGLVVANMKPNADNIAQICRRMVYQFPTEHAHIKIPMGKMGTEIEWGEVDGKPWDSRILIATASSENFARSFDYNFVHLSECAHYENPSAIAAAKSAASFADFIYEESTANGMDPYFYPSWQNALFFDEVRLHWRKHKALPPGWNGKYRFFWAWWQDPDYRVNLSPQQIEQIMDDLSEDEKDGVQLYGWDAEQIEWRRRKIADECSNQTQMSPEKYFKQEYPSCPEESFINYGTAVFDQACLVEMEERSRLVEPKSALAVRGVGEKGPELGPIKKDYAELLIWEEPRLEHHYIIGTDTLENTGDDYSVAIVYDRLNGEIMREVVSYRGKISGIELADLVFWLGWKYNTAYVVPRADVISTAQHLVTRGYPYIYQRKNEELVGDRKTQSTAFSPGLKIWKNTRKMIMDHSQDAFKKKQIELQSPWLIREHRIYSNKDGIYAAPVGETDDGIMATALAVFGQRRLAPRIEAPADLLPPVPEGKKIDPYTQSIHEAVARKVKKSERTNRRAMMARNRIRKTRNLF